MRCSLSNGLVEDSVAVAMRSRHSKSRTQEGRINHHSVTTRIRCLGMDLRGEVGESLIQDAGGIVQGFLDLFKARFTDGVRVTISRRIRGEAFGSVPACGEAGFDENRFLEQRLQVVRFVYPLVPVDE